MSIFTAEDKLLSLDSAVAWICAMFRYVTMMERALHAVHRAAKWIVAPGSNLALASAAYPKGR